MYKIKLRCNRDMTVQELLDENHISRKLRRSLKASSNIKKDDKVLYMAKMMKKGDIITLYVQEPESDINPIEMPLNIVFEDDEVIVIDKPYGLSVMSTLNMHEITLLNGLSFYLKKNEISSKVHVVNRLDKKTTGLMAIAKDRLSASLLSDSLKDTLIRKYYAIVRGILPKKEDIITLNIAKENNISVRRVIRNDGKVSITSYKVIQEFQDYSLLEIELKTGRTHQIRVVFNFLGHPLVGDFFYSGILDNEELMLHSHYLEFVSPLTQEKIVLDTKIPERFKIFIQKNGGII